MFPSSKMVERSPRVQSVVGSNPTQGSSCEIKSCPGCSGLSFALPLPLLPVVVVTCTQYRKNKVVVC